jgi:hypothetical protein
MAIWLNRTGLDAKTSGLDAIAGEAKRAGHKGPPPVHSWNPPFCGDLDMRIAADGTWFYLKTPIGGPLVKLFVMLRRDGENISVTSKRSASRSTMRVPRRRGESRRRGGWARSVVSHQCR